MRHRLPRPGLSPTPPLLPLGSLAAVPYSVVVAEPRVPPQVPQVPQEQVLPEPPQQEQEVR